jgi:hypothetical protein
MEGNPNNPLLAKFQSIDAHSVTSAAWEHARIMHLIQVTGYKTLLSELKQIAATSTYTFDDFNQVCNDFPFVLFADTFKGQPPIHRDNRSVHPMWFKSFTVLPLVKKYLEKHKSFSGKKPVGMVFPRKGFQQGLILHNGDPDKFVPSGSGCHLYKAEDGSTMVVQSFTGFLNHLRSNT